MEPTGDSTHLEILKKCQTKVQENIDALSKLINQTRLFICEKFDSLISDIDLEAEQVIQSHEFQKSQLLGEGKSVDEVNQTCDALSATREEMVLITKREEKNCLDNFQRNLEDFQREQAKLSIQLEKIESAKCQIDQNIEAKKENMSELIDEYRRLNENIADISTAFETKIFCDRSLIYVKNLNRDIETWILSSHDEVNMDRSGASRAEFLQSIGRQVRDKPDKIGYLVKIESTYLSKMESFLFKILFLRKRDYFHQLIVSGESDYILRRYFKDMQDLQENIDFLLDYAIRPKNKLCFNAVVIYMFFKCFYTSNSPTSLTNIVCYAKEKCDHDFELLEKFYSNHASLSSLGSSDDWLKISENFKNLEEINFSFNSLSTFDKGVFDFKPLENLTSLYLDFNAIQELGDNIFIGLSNLANLVLNSNKLSKIQPNAFNGLFNLKFLGMNFNNLEKLDRDLFVKLEKLTELCLCRNKLEHIDTNAFNGLSNLTTLRLPNNNLRELIAFQFKGLKSLKDLFLTDNVIATMHPEAFNSLTNLENVMLVGNPVCDNFRKAAYFELQNTNVILRVLPDDRKNIPPRLMEDFL